MEAPVSCGCGLGEVGLPLGAGHALGREGLWSAPRSSAFARAGIHAQMKPPGLQWRWGWGVGEMGELVVCGQCILVYSQMCATIITVNVRTFSSPPKETPNPLATCPPPFLYSQTLSNQSSTSCHQRLAYSGHFIAWNHTICYPLCLVSFTEHVFKVHPCCGLCQYFIPFFFFLAMVTPGVYGSSQARG